MGEEYGVGNDWIAKECCAKDLKASTPKSSFNFLEGRGQGATQVRQSSSIIPLSLYRFMASGQWQ